MKKYITFITLLAAGTAFANAEEVSIDLSSYTTTVLRLNSGLKEAVTAAAVTNWLGEADSGNWYATTGQGNNYSIWPTATDGTTTGATSDGNTGIDLNFCNRGGVSGARVALVLDLGKDYLSYESLKFDVEMTSSTAVSSAAIHLVYSLNDSYQIASSTFTSLGEKAKTSVVADCSSGLSSSVIYAIISSTGGGGNSTSYNVNMKAAIPEPSAFGLLAGLGALVLVGARRRRR